MTAFLVLTLLVETMALGIGAIAAAFDPFSSSGFSPSGIANINDQKLINQMKKDFLKTLRSDLVKRIEDYELSGPVGLIVTFSDDSLISAYSSSKYADKMSYNEFRETSAAKKLKKEMDANRDEVIARLEASGIDLEVKHTYEHTIDGIFINATYEDVSAICEIEGVERVMVSNTYLPQAAVDNPVDVYETGIFNSGSVEYTGKGTVVAVLDTGCDYAHSAFTTYEVKNPKYDRDYIESILEKTNAYELTTGGLEAREVYYGNLTGNKIVFGYDYADKDPDIMPFSESHGTHVAGIIAGKDDVIEGVAIDAQLVIMKVFSDYKQGADDGDIIAALEDCVDIGVDAINLSLGISCGFSIERDEEKIYKNEVYSRLEKAGVSVIVAASNDYSSGQGGEESNTNKTSNPDSATVGAPATYESSFSVASINGKKDNYMLANGDQVVFFTKSFSTSADEYDFFGMLGIKEGEKKTYEYVTVPGLGLAVNYAGIDVKGKIALVSRGDITFEEKVQYAQEAGAIAVIIYNNVYGNITMTIGNHAKIPAVSIGRDEGEMLVAKNTGTLEFDLSNAAGPFMSDFSSWGPTPDLKLKPEITAHGGNIKSAVVGGEYDELSGTSMASPNMCGITVLIRQYVNEKYPDLSHTESRDLVNRLCMSTATIIYDRKGNPYSPRKQGAGLADIRKATTTEAYLYVDGIGKTKLELGDDPKRTGVYEMEIDLVNMSSTEQKYRLGNITMTESVSTSDPEYVAELAYLLNNASEYSAEGGTITDGVLTVAGGATATVKVKLTLSKEDKSYLNETFENGMFIEGFLTFDNLNESGVDLNAPFLAFYGDWGEAPLFDLDFYEVETEAHNNAIDDDDKIKADYYATTPLGTYYYDYIIPLGSYIYANDESEYDVTPATRDRAAISYYSTCISGVYGAFVGLLRGARELSIQVKNATTGEIIYEEIQYNCYKSHFVGAPRGYMSKIDLAALDLVKNETTGETEVDSILGFNNNKFEVTMSAKLDWDGDSENDSDSYSYSFYIDYEAPSVVDATYRTEYDKTKKENRYYLDAIIYDNHYAMSCRPVVIYEIQREGTGDVGDDDFDRTFSSLTKEPIPVYQENRGESTKVSIEITDYIDQIASSSMPNGVTLYIDDYAMNGAVCYIPFPETDDYDDLEFMDTEINLDINQTFDLTEFFVHEDTTTPVESDYLKTLKWSSSDESVVTIKGGRIEALKAGTATIKVTADSWVTKIASGEDPVTEQLYKSIVVNVSENRKTDDPNSSLNVQIEELRFASYDTLFAFNGDIDRSMIGETGTTHYFGGDYSLEVYPSEKIQLTPELKPWNMAESRYKYTWVSSNPKVATVDENGIVTAQAEGNARITLKIEINGKTSLLAARLALEVKSEFIIENRKLVAYKGWGGDVVIPDDEGILYIGAFAFSHFDLDNAKEVEVDKDGNYDFDDKKTAIGNDTVTSVVIPEDVETIEKYAFYNCSELTKVTLPESCKQIGGMAFEKCAKLESINCDKVKIIENNAFNKCTSLADVGETKLSGVYAIGNLAFSGAPLKSVSLDNLSRIGTSCFKDCTNLETVTLGKRTRVTNSMFRNTPVKNLVIYSDSVDNNAFYGCNQLESVVFENDVTYLGSYAFSGCSALTSVTFKGDVEQISSYAFNFCTELENLTLPNCEFTLGNSAFANSGITKLTFAENTEIISIGESVLKKNTVTDIDADVTASTKYNKVNGAIYTKDGKTLVLVLPKTSLTEFEVPASVEVIGSGAFSSIPTLNSVTFGENSQLKHTGDFAFANCNNLESIAIPENNITIGEAAFKNATKLSSFDFSRVTEIGASAFAKSGGNMSITSITNFADGVKIGEKAFANSSLTAITLSDGAIVGDSAFMNSPSLVSVDCEGSAVIGNSSFVGCTSLAYFDFAEVTEIGDKAFMGCKLITSVDAPEVITIGDYAFSTCTEITSLNAPKLKRIGKYAFSIEIKGDESFQYANKISSFNLPVVEEIGERAFFGSIYLTSADLSGVKVGDKEIEVSDGRIKDGTKKITVQGYPAIGEGAFYFSGLKQVTLPEGCKALPDYVFASCLQLLEIDLSEIVYIGEGALSTTPLAYGKGTLELPKVEYIGMQAFYEMEGYGHYLTGIVAPELKHVDDYAFANCTNLAKVTAPKIEYLGEGAFTSTVIEEFEVSDSLTTVEYGAFYKTEKLEAFYATDSEGERIDNVKLQNFMLKDGALYKNYRDGYILTIYPVAKRDLEYVVADGTTLIQMGAADGNKYIEKVIFPSSLEMIGNLAFDGCENLETVVFNSYYAPVLEGSYAKEDAIKIENVDDIVGFDDLYKYDYFWMSNNEVAAPLHYSNFKDTVATVGAQGLTAILPDNCEGYDTPLYKAYFTVSEETSGKTMGKFAIAFIKAVKNLPEVVDRFDRLLIEDAIGAYNALQGHSEESIYVTADLLAKYEQACAEYNANIVEDKINHLYDMDMKEYCFNAVKDARAAYLALNETEKALVSNYAVLEGKINDLNTLYGKEIDFDLTYAENLPANEDPTDDTPDKKSPWVIIVIIVASVLVAGGAAVAVVFIIKKKKTAAVVEEISEASEETVSECDSTEEGETAPTEDNTDAKED